MRADLIIDPTQPLVWTVSDVMTPTECEVMVQRFDALGYEEALVNSSSGPRRVADHRNNDRVIFDDQALADRLFERVRTKLPDRIFDWELAGLNERFRGYRYEAGQYFAEHYDGDFVRDQQERSFLTFMVYLNEGCGGGATSFPSMETDVQPKVGQALLFQHRLLHAGSPVTSGTKIVLRSDVMYQRPNDHNTKA